MDAEPTNVTPLPSLEFWPDYGPGPLWRGGEAVDVVGLGLPERLGERLVLWNAAFEEDKVPGEGDGDAAWLAEGLSLLAETRTALAGRYDVVVTEPFWGEDPEE